MSLVTRIPFIIILLTILCSAIEDTYAQNWTLFDGTSKVNQQPKHRFKGVQSDLNFWGSRSSHYAWTDANGKVWVYGGAFRSDIWTYDLTTKKWVWVHGSDSAYAKPRYGIKGIADSTNNPGYRLGPGLTHDKEGNLWLFGGGQQSYVDFYDDLWKFDITTGMWTWMKGQNISSPLQPPATKGLEDSIANPRCLLYPTIWCDNNNNIWTFGGFGFNSYSQELWKYNTKTNNWTWIHGVSFKSQINALANYGQKGISSPSNAPGARRLAMGWTDASGNLWLFGGFGEIDTNYFTITRYLNDLWKFNPATNEWTWIHGSNKHNQKATYGSKGFGTNTTSPGTRYLASTIVDRNNDLLLFGGFNNLGRCNEFWKYNINNNTWTWMDGDSTLSEGVYKDFLTAKPGGRDACGLILDKLGNLFVFGGYGYAENGVFGTLTDVWRRNSCDSIVFSDTPTVVVVKNATCFNDTIKLKINHISKKNSADFWVWRKDSCNGKIIAYGDSITILASVANRYFIRGEGSCFSGGNCGSYEVVLADSIKPQIVAPKDIDVIADSNCIKVIDSLGSPILSENCSIKSVENDAPSFFHVGVNKVVWKITDQSNNTDTAIQIVTVRNGIQNEVVLTKNSLYAKDSLKSFQWIDCANNYAPITGAKNFTYVPQKTGVYAVVIKSTNGCTDTSDCIPFNYVGVKEQAETFNVEIWPNPTTNGMVNLKLTSTNLQPLNISITNNLGQEISFKEYVTTGENTLSIDIGENYPGVYFVNITADKQALKRKITLIK
ncbi:MAG: T9SS C-terminal target domain-containing protein [Bacteroidetes bacterium]|nr:MAG: T9SS C-terminal target domain-containing protein [Bacteroidota bacterium]